MSKEGRDEEDYTLSAQTTNNNSTENADTSKFLLLLKWLKPQMKDYTDSGRKGILSTYEEIHAAVIGLMVGIAIPAAGLAEVLAALAGAGTIGSRVQRTVPKKYIEQAKRELPHLIGGVIVGWGVTNYLINGAVQIPI